MRVLINDPRVVDWLGQRIPNFPPDISMTHTLSWEMDGEIRAACLYRNYYENDIELIIAVDNAGPLFGRKAMAIGFGYPFQQLGCRRVTANVAATNAKSKQLVERLGFRLEGIKRKAVSEDTDLLLYGMLREECRWIYGRI